MRSCDEIRTLLEKVVSINSEVIWTARNAAIIDALLCVTNKELPEPDIDTLPNHT